jgi:hypothetical protein
MVKKILIAILLALPVAMPIPRLGALRASVPPQCDIQRSAYCLMLIEAEARFRPFGGDGATEIEVLPAIGVRRHRIIEPVRCLRGPADVIPGYPTAADVRRTDNGWLHFTMRLRGDGSCDLQVSQQVPEGEHGTEYDRVMWMPIVICLGESLASNPGAGVVDREFTRFGSACSLKY